MPVLMIYLENISVRIVGANPGPACYKRGGPLTVTDANAVLNRILPNYFPKIFGESRKEALDVSVSRRLFADLTNKINSFHMIFRL